MANGRLIEFNLIWFICVMLENFITIEVNWVTCFELVHRPSYIHLDVCFEYGIRQMSTNTIHVSVTRM